MTEQEKYMKAALKLAHKAAEEGEVRSARSWSRRKNRRTRPEPP